MGFELKDGRKKIKLSKAKPWFEKRRQAHEARKWFEKEEGRERESLADATSSKKDERVVPARTECWK